jgi:RNA polymerase sigma-70 factor (ECF subfamily)
LSAEPSGRAPHLVEHFFRHEAGRLMATLTRRFGAARLELVEDAVQSALERALTAWTRSGIPDNPSAWLTRVASNCVLDALRSREGSLAAEEKDTRPAEQLSVPPEVPAPGPRDELRLLFACADESLPERARLVLCMKLVSGFSTREIAARLFTSEANVQKLLERGRSQLRESFRELGSSELPDLPAQAVESRLPLVQHVIYLQFNEGYSSQREDEPVRAELCEDALRLAQLLLEHPETAAPTTWALLALMHFHLARIASRVDASGNLLLLSEQDRTTWDRAHLSAGTHCLLRSAAGPHFSRYHGEAAILAEHCLAPRYEDTRWAEIVDLYDLLGRLQPSPLYRLNRAIALLEWKGAAAALAALRAEAPPSWLAGYYLWLATLGEVERRAGLFEDAEQHLTSAIAATPTNAERQVFERRLERARRRDGGR